MCEWRLKLDVMSSSSLDEWKVWMPIVTLWHWSSGTAMFVPFTLQKTWQLYITTTWKHVCVFLCGCVRPKTHIWFGKYAHMCLYLWAYSMCEHVRGKCVCVCVWMVAFTYESVRTTYVFFCFFFFLRKSMECRVLPCCLSLCVCVVLHLEKVNAPLTSWSAEWGGEAVPVGRHGHFSPDSNILPHFPWYRRPLSPLALPLWPPDLTRKTLCHPPHPSFQLFIRPFLLPQSIWGQQLMDGPSGEGCRKGQVCFLELCRGTARRWRETNWGKIGTDLRKERNEGKTCWGKGSTEENTKNCQSVQTIPPQCCACSLHLLLPSLPCRSPHPYFSSPASSLAPFCLCCLLSVKSTGDCCVFWYMLVWLLECAH